MHKMRQSQTQKGLKWWCFLKLLFFKPEAGGNVRYLNVKGTKRDIKKKSFFCHTHLQQFRWQKGRTSFCEGVFTVHRPGRKVRDNERAPRGTGPAGLFLSNLHSQTKHEMTRISKASCIILFQLAADEWRFRLLYFHKIITSPADDLFVSPHL